MDGEEAGEARDGRTSPGNVASVLGRHVRGTQSPWFRGEYGRTVMSVLQGRDKSSRPYVLRSPVPLFEPCFSGNLVPAVNFGLILPAPFPRPSSLEPSLRRATPNTILIEWNPGSTVRTECTAVTTLSVVGSRCRFRPAVCAMFGFLHRRQRLSTPPNLDAPAYVSAPT